MQTISRYLLPACLAFVIGLAGCSPAGQAAPTLVPTIALDIPAAQATEPAPQSAPTSTAPAAGEATAYPAAFEPLPGEFYPYPYPAPGGAPGPNGVPARPNRSEMEARLLESAPGDPDPAVTRLRVLVLSARPLDGGDFTANLANQEINLFVQNLEIPGLRPGDTFTAEVTYLGDESGGNFYITRFVSQ